MLATFPTLLSFPLLAYFLLRLVLSLSVIKIAYRRKNKSFSFLAIPEAIFSIFIIIGLYTQIFSILVLVCLIVEMYLNTKDETRTNSDVLFILSVISISLLFTGPGSFAFDLPL